MKKGFSLTELLAVLGILGVIAAFTIPKVLQAQQESNYKATAKEAFASIALAHEKEFFENGITATTKNTDLYAHLNYVSFESTSGTIIDNNYATASTRDCSQVSFCYVLHSGGIVWGWEGQFGSTDSTAAVFLWFDPDASTSTTEQYGPGKSIRVFQYADGLVRSASSVIPGTCMQGSCVGAPFADPPWFSWD